MTTIERVIALQRVALFADTPGRILAAVARRATEVEVAAGEVVIDEGSVEDHLFALVRGRLRVHRGESTVATLEPGAAVGELAALVPEPRSASVTAVEPSTLLRIEKAVLVIQFYFYAVLIYALMSWFGGASYSPVGQVLGRLVEPLLAPFRRIIPPIGGLDLSALFLMIALQAVLILLRSP